MNKLDPEIIKANGKEFTLKIGKLVLISTDISHYYWLNEEYMPGVSTILGEAAPTPYGLKLWWQNNTKDEADAIFEAAGDFGSKMHEAYEKLLKGEELDVLKDYPSEKEKKALMAFDDWFRHYKPVEFESEQSIASLKYKYAGTLDFVGLINNEATGKSERWIIDFKTSNAIHMSHQLQVLAYKQAYEESYGITIDRVGILRTGTTHKGTTAFKEGKLKETGKGWEFREIKDYTIDNFMNIYKTYLMLHGGEIPEPPEISIYPAKLKLLEEVK